MTDLQELKKDLAEKLKAKQEAIEMSNKASADYELALLKWEADHDDLVQAKNKAIATEKVYKDVFAAARADTARQLEDYFDENPEEKDKVKGLSFRHEREPKWVGGGEALVKALADSGLYWLLQPRQDVAKELVFNNSELVEDDERGFGHTYTLPSYWSSIVPLLSVKTIIKPQISDKDLLK